MLNIDVTKGIEKSFDIPLADVQTTDEILFVIGENIVQKKSAAYGGHESEMTIVVDTKLTINLSGADTTVLTNGITFKVYKLIGKVWPTVAQGNFNVENAGMPPGQRPPIREMKVYKATVPIAEVPLTLNGIVQDSTGGLFKLNLAGTAYEAVGTGADYDLKHVIAILTTQAGEALALSGINLDGANLSNANLNGANLTDAELTGANLSNAELTGAYLRNAELSNANLTGATLENATLENASLENANLRNANLGNASFIGTVLTGATMPSNADTKAEFKALVGSWDAATTIWTDGEPIG